MKSAREPFGGKWFGIWNVEGEGEPLALYPSLEEARTELERRQALDPEHDDHLSEYHHVFPCDVMGAWWNSYDPDPRENEPLTNEEIMAVHAGDG